MPQPESAAITVSATNVMTTQNIAEILALINQKKEIAGHRQKVQSISPRIKRPFARSWTDNPSEPPTKGIISAIPTDALLTPPADALLTPPTDALLTPR
jgi:hypothetical protein